MPTDRTLILKGPAILQWLGYNIYVKGAITIRGMLETFSVETSLKGKEDERITGRSVEVTCQPSGMIETAGLAALWPYGSTAIGDSIFANASTPANDNSLVILTRGGKKITIYAAAITKLPTLSLGATETPIGSMTWTGIRKNNTDSTNANAIYKVEAQAWSDPGTFSLAAIRTAAYTASWAAAGAWSSFKSVAGWQIDFSISTTPVRTDSDGLVDMLLSDLQVTAKCRPLPGAAALAEAEILDAMPLQGTNAAQGASLAGLSTTYDLAITNGTTPACFTLTLSKAAMTDNGLNFDREDHRNGECTWKATRNGTNPLYTLAIS